MSNLNLLDVVKFATEAHAGQVRKHTGEPYMVHPLRVARRAEEELRKMGVFEEEHIKQIVAGALLHDVVEDTKFSLVQIEKRFGPVVANLVRQVSDVSRKRDGNRAARKAIDLAHYAKAGETAKFIKLLDSIDNLRDIAKTDPKFAPTYVAEMEARLPVLQGVHSELWFELYSLILAYRVLFPKEAK